MWPIFRTEIDSWFVHPDLDVSIIPNPPDCEKINDNTYWFRLRVENLGNKGAEKVEVFAKELLKLDEKTNSFEKVKSFLPIRLLWTHIGTPTFDVISPRTFKHCELGFIIKDSTLIKDDGTLMDRGNISAERTVFYLNVEVCPSTKFNRLGPGNYRLGLLIASANFRKSVKKTLEIDFKMWSDLENEMINDNIIIKIIKE
ncbi:MAG: hypothetical protein WA130_19410 [Candidatus Methanoperedens sp.]